MFRIFKRTHPLYRPREISREELPWMLRRNVWTATLGTIAIGNLTGGPFFTAYCQEMGMPQYMFGLLTTFMMLMTFLMLLSPAIEEHFGQRKYPWFVFATASRSVFAIFILGLFVKLNPWIIVLTIVGWAALANLASPLWESWAWSYIPGRRFARFWARRNFWCTLALTASALAVAPIINHMPHEGRAMGISALFAVLLVVGMLDVLFHVKIPESPRQARPAGSLSKIREAFSNPPFRLWVFAVAVWYFGVMVAGPFCLPYMLYDLGFKDDFFIYTVLTTALPAACTLLTLRYWGRAVDSRYRGTIVVVSSVFWTAIPLFYFLATPQNSIRMLGAAWIIGGIFPFGVILAVPLITKSLSGEDKTMPAAIVSIAANVGMMFGAGLGTFIARAYSVRDTFAVSLVLRAVGAFLFFLIMVYRPLGREKANQLPLQALAGRINTGG